MKAVCLFATVLSAAFLLAAGDADASRTRQERVPSCEISFDGDATCRLTFCGNGVWRVLSDGADPKGAVQALSSYLGEAETCPARPFDVARRSDGTFVATGADGSRVVRTAGGVLQVFAAGVARPVLSVGFSTATGRACARGVLSEGEQVYGLGERLDAVGKRGQRVTLWSTDGYAKRDTTYLPIPFFCTTRGGGFFANTYRRCEADFGGAKDGVWSLQADEPCVDAYLLATASPAEAVCASSRLQGGTEPPPAWSAGPIICRLAPDFAEWEGPCFSGRNGRQQIGTGIRAVYEGHERIGAKPSAMLLEGLGGRLFDRRKTVRDQDRRRQADIGRKLSASGVRVMRYMRVGEVFKAMDLPGFKPEYVVRADVYTNGVLAAADTDLVPDAPRPGKNPDVLTAQPKFRYLDITNPEAWKWYLDSVWSVLSDCGVRGAKIDFCELLPEEGESYGGMCVRYKWHDPSVFARGALHHAYAPFFVARLVRAMRARNPEDGFFAFTRGGGIGSGRYPAVWAGDQWRMPYVAADQLRAILNASLSGVPYQTYDMAGYQYERQVYENVGCVNPKTRQIRLGASPEAGEEILYRRGPKTMKADEEADLFLNSLYTAYTMCLQTHGYVRHVYDFDDGAISAYRRAVGHLKALAPYREKLARENAETGLPPVRPLVLAYPKDANVYDLDDEFLLGDALLVAPVFNGRERSVYLPEGRWLDVSKGEEIAVPADGLRRSVSVPRGVVPLFVNLRSASAALVRAALQPPARAAAAQTASASIPTLVPVPQSTNAKSPWYRRFLEKDALVKKGGWKVVFLGDSITHGWESAGKTQWEREFVGEPYHALNLGFSGDRTENVAWRIDHGELDGYEAKAVVLMIGTNSQRNNMPLCKWNPVIDRILGVRELLRRIRAKQPKAKIVLCALFPRGADATSPYRETNAAINQAIQRFCDGKTIFWCDFSDRFLNPDGTLSAAMMPDYLHPKAPGYEIWAAAVKPFLNYALTAKEGDLPISQLFRGCADPGAFLPGKPCTAIPASRIAPADEQLKDGWLDRVETVRNEILNSKGAFDVVFLGDSITRAWDIPRRGKPVFDELAKTYSLLNLGSSGDGTQHLLWRIRFGELDNYKAKVLVLMIGTNNCAEKRREDVVAGVKEVLDEIAKRQPEAKVLLFSIFPRSQYAKDWARLQNEQVNEKIRAFADGQRVIWCDINAQLTNADGSIDPELMPDFLHPLTKGYEIWRDALLPHVKAACGK